jgi:glutamine synthetase
MKPKDVLAFAKENQTTMLDLRFMDFPGLWQRYRAHPSWKRAISRTGTVSTGPASAAGSRSTPATC